MRKSLAQSFTLVELLIVMGVLAVLVVTILVSLNPAEAGKKARDTKRMKDLRALEAIILQYIQDGGSTSTINGTCYHDGAGGGTDTTQACISAVVAGNITSQPCDNNWITGNKSTTGIDLCKYTNSVPIDPANARTCTGWGGTSSADPTPKSFLGSSCYYKLKVNGSDYKVSVLQESKSNINNPINDGGNRQDWVEAFSDPSLP